MKSGFDKQSNAFQLNDIGFPVLTTQIFQNFRRNQKSHFFPTKDDRSVHYNHTKHKRHVNTIKRFSLHINGFGKALILCFVGLRDRHVSKGMLKPSPRRVTAEISTCGDLRSRTQPCAASRVFWQKRATDQLSQPSPRTRLHVSHGGELFTSGVFRRFAKARNSAAAFRSRGLMTRPRNNDRRHRFGSRSASLTIANGIRSACERFAALARTRAACHWSKIRGWCVAWTMSGYQHYIAWHQRLSDGDVSTSPTCVNLSGIESPGQETSARVYLFFPLIFCNTQTRVSPRLHSEIGGVTRSC